MATTEQYDYEAIRSTIAHLGIDDGRNRELMEQIMAAKWVADERLIAAKAAEETKYLDHRKKTAQVTVIIDGPDGTTIVNVPFMENISINAEYDDPPAFDSRPPSSPPMKRLTIGGRPLRAKDGTYYTQIEREPAR